MKRIWKLLFTNPDHMSDEEVLASLLIYRRMLKIMVPIAAPFIPFVRGVCGTLWYLLQGVVLVALGLRDLCGMAVNVAEELDAARAFIRTH